MCELAGHGNLTEGKFTVYEGEREIAAYNKMLATIELTGLPPAKGGEPQIEVAFDIDANGIMHVSAKDLGTGEEQRVAVTGGSALLEADLERMVREAQRYAELECRRREAAETRDRADQLVYATEKFVQDHADTVPGDIKTDVEAAVGELKEALRNGDGAAVREAMWKTAAAAAAASRAADVTRTADVGDARTDTARDIQGGTADGSGEPEEVSAG
ncbi:Hsp70 family protein [Streptomyces turgidiscabies]|uniref:Molecular chaperone DnaK (HSP70) n=1 Tax=Streptomyces turgidiscabies TaxID=85558 RepID=A0ABU0RXS1_9ACTN|nr:molecular chaperone DnaK (HSP70) [Streptomyces turgidiscabies]